MKFQRLALIGCGLMGGSFALALRQAGLVEQVAGFSASEATRQKALKLGVIDSACASAAEAVQGADLVLVGDQPPDEALAARAGEGGLSVARSVVFPSMVMAGDRAQLHSRHAGWRAHDEYLSRRLPASQRGGD